MLKGRAKGVPRSRNSKCKGPEAGRACPVGEALND